MPSLEALVQRLELDATQFGRQLDNSHALIARYERRAALANRNVARSFQNPLVSIRNLRAAVGGLIAGLAVREVLAFADSFTQVQNALRVSGVEARNMVVVTDELFAVANRTRAPIGAMAQLFQQASLQTEDLGVSTRELIGFLETVGQSLAVSGTNATTARGALIQLGQALGSGKVRAQEFNAIQQGAPALLRAAAAGIDEAGGSVARLRVLVTEGKVSSEEFFQGIQAGAGLLRDAFARTVPTVEQAFTNLSTSITLFVGRTDSAAGGTRELARLINDLATAIASDEFQDFVASVLPAIRDGFQTATSAASAFWETFDQTDQAVADIQALLGWIERIPGALESAERGGPAAVFEDLFVFSGDPLEELERVNQGIADLLARRTALIREGTEENAAAIARQTSELQRLFGRQLQLTQQIEDEALASRFGGAEFTNEPARRLAQLEASQRQAALGGGGAGGGGVAVPDTADLDDAITKLQRQAQLLGDIRLTHDDIAAILSVEGGLERELAAAEQARLTSAVSTLAIAEERRAIASDVDATLLEIDAQGQLSEQLRIQTRLLEIKTDLGEEAARALTGEVTEAEQLRTTLERVNASRDLGDQLADLQLAIQFSGQETEEYRAQIALLRLKRELGEDVVAGLEEEVRAVERARTALQAATERRGIQGGIQQTRLGIQFAGDNATSQLLIGRESEESRVQQRLLALRQQGLDPNQFEEMIREAEGLNTQLAIMENVVPNIAASFASLAETAIFDSPKAAAEEFLRTIIRLTLQITLLKAAMGVANAFGPGAGAGGGGAATTPAGPTPLFPSSVIPRQHGGPTLPGVSYLVGERGPELFVPRQAGSIVPGGGAAPQITIVDQRGAQAPPVEQATDPRGAVSFIIRSEVTGMMRDGSLNRGLGVRQRGVARG